MLGVYVEPMSGPSGSILFVDDDLDLLEVFRAALSFTGHEHGIFAASLAEVKEQRAAVLGCSLAIVDVNLGRDRPNGLELVEWLRGEGFHGRVVFLSGHGADDPLIAKAAKVSSAQLIAKPIGLDELWELVGLAQVPA
jgi:FixJ family two-component response regulator